MADVKKRIQVVEFVAECFWPGVTKAEVVRLDLRLRTSTAALTATAARVHYLGSLLIPTDEVVFCFFDGPTAEAVEGVARRAKIPFDRILRSIRVPGVSRD